MPITVTGTQSVIATAQTDGRRWVRDVITLSNDRRMFRNYLASVGFDIAAFLSAWAGQVLNDLADAEVVVNVNAVSSLGSVAVPSLVYSTASQNIAAAREAYRSSSDREAIMIADYFNTLTNVQLQNAFGITSNQAINLRANTLAPAALTAVDLRTAVGQ